MIKMFFIGIWLGLLFGFLIGFVTFCILSLSKESEE